MGVDGGRIALIHILKVFTQENFCRAYKKTLITAELFTYSNYIFKVKLFFFLTININSEKEYKEKIITNVFNHPKIITVTTWSSILFHSFLLSIYVFTIQIPGIILNP